MIKKIIVQTLCGPSVYDISKYDRHIFDIERCVGNRNSIILILNKFTRKGSFIMRLNPLIYVIENLKINF